MTAEGYRCGVWMVGSGSSNFHGEGVSYTVGLISEKGEQGGWTFETSETLKSYLP